MLLAATSRLCGCSMVVKAKAQKLPAEIAQLHALMDYSAREIGEAWNEELGPAIEKVRSVGSASAAKAELRRVGSIARAFRRKPAMKALFDDLVRASYALGALRIRARDAEIRATGKLSPSKVGLRKKKSPAATIIADFDFSIADERGVAQLDKLQTLWVQGESGPLTIAGEIVDEEIVERAKAMLSSGESTLAVGQMLRKDLTSAYGVGAFEGKSLSYFAGVVDYAATSAAVAGALGEMKAAGWTRYEIVNPMDERTSPICQMMNGKTALVSDAVDLQEEMNAVAVSHTDPIAELKEIKPFASGGKTSAVTEGVSGIKATGAQDLSAKQSEALSLTGFSMPPFHFRCRSFIDIAFSVGDEVPMPALPGAAKPAPAPPKPKPAPPKPAPPKPKPAPPKPKPAPPKPKPQVVAPDSLLPPAFDLPEGGFPFFLEECEVIPMNLGGSVKKFAIKAPDGSTWMFKDYTSIGSEFLADVEATASLAAQAAGVPHSATYKLTLPRDWAGWGAGESPRKVTGGVQRLFNSKDIVSDGIGKGVGGANIETFGANAVIDIQTDHAINWLISNGDAHYDNFIELAGGRIAGIDKGQAFKFFGKDRLAIDYISPQSPIPSTNGFAYGESQFVRYSKGKMGKDFELAGVFDVDGELTELGRRLQAIVDIPDAEYAASIRPYVEEMKKRGFGLMSSSSPYSTVEEGVEAIVARKRALLDDVADLYDDLEKRRRKSLGMPAFREQFGGPPAPIAPPAPSAGPMADFSKRSLFDNFDEVCEEAIESRMTGYAAFTGGAEVEDMFLKVMRHDTAYDGKSRFTFRGRLRPDASNRLRARVAGSEYAGSGSPAVGHVDDIGIEAYMAKPKAERIRLATMRIEQMWTGDADIVGDVGVFRFVKSYAIRRDASLGHQMLGDSLGQYEGVYDKLLAKFTKLAGPGTSKAKRIALSEELGYEVTAAEVKTAIEYRNLLKGYKKAGKFLDEGFPGDGGVFVNQRATGIVRVGKLDDFVKVKPAAAAPAPVAPPKKFEPTVSKLKHKQAEGKAFATESVDIGSSGIPTISVDYLDETTAKLAEQLSAKSYKAQGPKTDVFVIKHPTRTNVQIRFSPHDNSLRDFQGDFRLVFRGVKRGSIPSAADRKAMEELLEHYDLKPKTGGPELDEMKMLWARKQARAIGLDLDASTKSLFASIPDDLPLVEQLDRLAGAFDEAASMTGKKWLRWKSLTGAMDDADYLPVFTEKTGKAGGHPTWLRRDMTEEGLRDAGIRGAYVEVTGTGLEGLLDIMLKGDNLAFNSTNYRVQNGVPWWNSMSPTDDMRTGGSNYVFTRVNIGDTHSYSTGKYAWDYEDTAAKIKAGTFDPAVDRVEGISAGVYFNRKAMLATDNIFYKRDLYGEVSSDAYINSNMGKTLQAAKAKSPESKIASHMSYSGSNEMIVKGTLGINENAEYWVVKNHSERRAMIKAAKDNGITELGGKPVEQFFLSR